MTFCATIGGTRLAAWRFALVLLCVLLVGVCGTLHSSHIHAAGDLFHADCSLCATAHLTVQVISPAVMPLVASVPGSVEAVAPLIRCTNLSTFALFTRPPPDESASA